MKQFWRWVPAVTGGALLLLGAAAAFWPRQAVQVLPVLLGLAVLALGASHVNACVQQKSLSAVGPLGIPHLAQGLANLAVGVVLIVKTDVSVTFLGAVLGLWAVVSGVLSLYAAWELRKDPLVRGSVLDGVLKIGVGVLMLLRPFGSMALWTRLVGVFLMLTGAGSVITALLWDRYFGDRF